MGYSKDIKQKGTIMKVLQLNTSIRGLDSFSTKYANKISEKLKSQYNAEILVRDLATTPVTQLNNVALSALFSGELQHPVIAEHTSLIEEIKEVDTLVLAVPMYNFSIPATLKNYFDAISRAGVTFSYSSNGPVGLLHINKAYVVLTRGGVYRDKVSYQEEFLTTMLKFLGVKEVEFIYVEGLNYGEDSVEIADKYALEQITAI